jgi:uncharacterized protein YjbI with pentapeptide repeats
VFADISRANFTGAVMKNADLTGAHRHAAKGLAEATISDR